MSEEVQVLTGLQRISEGGFGALYYARQGDEAVALKLQDLSEGGRVQRFEREVAALKTLDHPLIVALRSAGISGRCGWMIMDWVEGPSLEDCVRDCFRDTGFGPSEEWIAERFAELVRALMASHEAGILHRDVKPANIIIRQTADGQDQAVLLDFGLAKLAGVTGMSVTATGETIGTPGYLSPEQLAAKTGEEVMTEAVDVWGLGASLHFAMSGEAPFARGTMVELFAAIMNSDPQDLSRSHVEASHWLIGLSRLCLQKDAGSRPGLEAVLEILESKPSSAKETVSILWVIALALIALLTGAGLVWALWPAPAQLLESPSLPSWTNAKALRIVGRLDRPGREIRCQEQVTTSDAEGRFEFSVDLAEGLNVWELSVGGRKLCALESRADFQPPHVLRDEATGPIPWPARGLFRAQVHDAGPVEVRHRGELVELTEGVFEVQITPQPKGQELRLELRDAAGNQSSVTIEVSSPLEDLWVWKSLSSAEQDQIIATLGRSLGKDFEWVETQVFECGEQSFRIGSFRHLLTGIVFRLIPGGEFELGAALEDAGRDKRELPLKRWRIAPFLMAQNELSFEAWNRLTPEMPKPGRDELPVNRFSWEDLGSWVRAAGSGIRVPLETEWEYACRAGSRLRYVISDDGSNLAKIANFKDGGQGELEPATRRAPNAFGLYAMLGNCWDWCVRVEGESAAVCRGGCVQVQLATCRPSFRGDAPLSGTTPLVGVRLAKSLP